MSWTYSGDPSSSDLDKYRFMLGDTIAEEPLMQNEEIQFIVDTYTKESTRMYQLYNRAATLLSRDIKKSLGPQSQDPTERLKFYKEQADYFKMLATSASGLSLPVYAYPKAFRKGMQNNPPAHARGDYV